MKTFREWRIEKGLADVGFTDQGPPKIKNKNIANKWKIPSIPTFSFERGKGILSKVDG